MTENIKKNMVGVLFEKAPLVKLPHGLERSYHTFTQDMILNEIFRRVEPQGRTMAEYFEQEIREQFGFEGVYLRMNESELKYVYDGSFIGFRKQLGFSQAKDPVDRYHGFQGWTGLLTYLWNFGKKNNEQMSLVDTQKYHYPIDDI